MNRKMTNWLTAATLLLMLAGYCDDEPTATHTITGKSDSVDRDDSIDDSSPEIIPTGSLSESTPGTLLVKSAVFTFDSSKYSAFLRYTQKPGEPWATHIDMGQNVDSLEPPFDVRRPVDETSDTVLQFADWLNKSVNHAGTYPIQAEGNLQPKGGSGSSSGTGPAIAHWAGKIGTALVDIDVDTNNDGQIDSDNTGEDKFEDQAPGALLFATREGEVLYPKRGGILDPPVPIRDHAIKVKLNVEPAEGDDGEVRIWWPANAPIRVAHDENFRRTVSRGQRWLLPRMPTEIYVDAQNTVMDVQTVSLLLEYKSFVNSSVEKDEASVTLLPTVSVSPMGGDVFAYDSVYGWHRAKGGTDAILSLGNWDFAVTGYKDETRKGWGSKTTIDEEGNEVTRDADIPDDDVGACTYANLTRCLRDASFLSIHGHGGHASIMVATFETRRAADAWMPQNRAGLSLVVNTQADLYGFGIYASGPLFRQYAAEAKKYQRITFFQSCNSGAGMPLYVGGRAVLGYTKPSYSNYTSRDMQKLVALMTTSSKTRTLGQAVARINEIHDEEGQYSEYWVDLSLSGNPYTTLIPSLIDEAYWPRNELTKDAWGAVVFDTFIQETDAATSLVKISGTSNLSNLSYVRATHKWPVGIGFNCTEGCGSAKVSYRLTCSMTLFWPDEKGRLLDGYPLDNSPHGDFTWEWN